MSGVHQARGPRACGPFPTNPGSRLGVGLGWGEGLTQGPVSNFVQVNSEGIWEQIIWSHSQHPDVCMCVCVCVCVCAPSRS